MMQNEIIPLLYSPATGSKYIMGKLQNFYQCKRNKKLQSDWISIEIEFDLEVKQ